MASKTMEDWFLRGGAKPQPAESENDNKDGMDPIIRLTFCQNCGGLNLSEEAECTHCGASLAGGCPTDEYCGADDGDGKTIQDWIVMMSRTKTVQQTAEVRVKAHSEEEALDLIEDRAEDEAENWPWEDNDDTEEFEDVEAVEAEVAE